MWAVTFNSRDWITTSEGEVAPRAEIYATHIENRLRAEHGISLRTHYEMLINGNGLGPRIIRRKTRESMFYDSGGNTNYSKLRRGQIPFIYPN